MFLHQTVSQAVHFLDETKRNENQYTYTITHFRQNIPDNATKTYRANKKNNTRVIVSDSAKSNELLHKTITNVIIIYYV